MSKLRQKQIFIKWKISLYLYTQALPFRSLLCYKSNNFMLLHILKELSKAEVRALTYFEKEYVELIFQIKVTRFYDITKQLKYK